MATIPDRLTLVNVRIVGDPNEQPELFKLKSNGNAGRSKMRSLRSS